MRRRTLTTSEEDSTAGPLHLRQANALADYVQRAVDAPACEWLAALLLTPQQTVIDTYLIELGRYCPLQRPMDKIEQFFATAAAVRTHTFISVRYHPHPPLLITAEMCDEFDAFRLTAESHGIPLRNHLTTHITGEIISWRDWDQSPGSSETFSGTRLRISTAMRFLA